MIPPVLVALSATAGLQSLVDLRGFEPLTFSMPLRRAPNCATGPYNIGVALLRAGICSTERLPTRAARYRRPSGNGYIISPSLLTGEFSHGCKPRTNRLTL